MKSKCFLFPVFLFCLFVSFKISALYVDVVANFNVRELPSNFWFANHNEFKVRLLECNDYILNRASPNQCRKIIVFNGIETRGLPYEKLVLFEWEPWLRSADSYTAYSRVYTWNDNLVDNVKFFRFNYPYLMPMLNTIPRYEDKKLCAMFSGNWCEHRFDVLKFFETKPEGEFDFYGNPPPQFANSKMWKGKVPGQHSGP